MRVLVLTHRLPYAPNRGDRIRAFHLLGALREQFDVDLVSLVHDEKEASHAPEVAARGIHVTIAPVPRLRTRAHAAAALVGSTPLTHCLLSSPSLRATFRRAMAERRPDVVLAYCSGMARFALQPPLTDVPFVLDMVDVDSEKWRALAALNRWPRRWVYGREHVTLRAFERRAVEAAYATVVVNQRELDVLRELAPGARIEVVESGVDADHFRNPGSPASEPVAIFVGVMNYPPNEAGAVWMAREVWPHVLAQVPTARLLIVGANPTAAVQALASSSVRVTGSVPDTRPFLWEAAVGVAPLATARGVQNKVLEAVSAGLPVVVTSAVHHGLPPEVMGACSVADSTEEFSRRVVGLLRLSAEERRAISESARLGPLKWSSRLARVPELCRSAAQRRSPVRVA